MSYYLWFLYWLIINISELNYILLFNSLLRNIINFNFISNIWNIFSYMLNLLIISVWFRNWNIICLCHCLVLSNCSSYWYIFNSLLWNLFNILSFIWNLNIWNLRFIVNICLLNGNILNIALCLWLLSLNKCSCRNYILNWRYNRLNYRIQCIDWLDIWNWLSWNETTDHFYNYLYLT